MESQNEKLSILFHGNNEILKVINSGASLEKLFGLPNEKCNLLNKEISSTESPNKFIITHSQNNEKKIYQIEKGNIQITSITADKNDLHKILKGMGIHWKNIKDLQTLETIKAYNTSKSKFTVLVPPDVCNYAVNRTFDSIPYKNSKVFVPENSYLCSNDKYVEFVIGSYTGKLLRDEICINFSDVYSLFSCVSEDLYKENATDFSTPKKEYLYEEIYQQYIFTDYFPEMYKYKKCISLDTYTSSSGLTFDSDSREMVQNVILTQTLFAIAIYQEKYQISHNNLSSYTIYLEKITEHTEFRGIKLHNADYFHYQIHGRDIFIPYIPVIVKIGNFTLGTKFSKPIVGLKEIFEDGMDGIIPNHFIKSYDSLMFLVMYTLMLDLKFENIGNLVEKCIYYACPGVLPSHGNIKKQLVEMEYYNSASGRPNLDNLDKVKTAKEILEGPIYNKYWKIPKDGEVVHLGDF